MIVADRQPPIPEPGADLTPILLAAARGDEAAWRRVIDLFARRVFALAKSRCRSSEVAEEITQSVFATVAAKLGSGEYTEQGRFESWLFRVAMNRVRDHARRERRRAAAADPAVLAEQPDRGEARTEAGGGAWAEESHAELSRLREAMEQLPASDREVLELRHHGGLSFKQLAELLEEPVGTLLARHHRALKKLQSLMASPDAAIE